MNNRKIKKSFPLNEFSILFSEKINSAMNDETDISLILDCYPESKELQAMLFQIRRSLKFILYQEVEDSAFTITKKQYDSLISELPLEKVKAMKRTGFKFEILEKITIKKESLDDQTIVFVYDSIYYRMMLRADALSNIHKYIEKHRFHEIREIRKGQVVKRNLFETHEDISLLKLKILISAVCLELKNILV